MKDLCRIICIKTLSVVRLEIMWRSEVIDPVILMEFTGKIHASASVNDYCKTGWN
jgi:hypothetical protein